MSRENTVKGCEVLSMLNRHNQPISFSEIVNCVALERNMRPQDIEANVMDTLNVGARLGLVGRTGDYYCARSMHPELVDVLSDHTITSVTQKAEPQAQSHGEPKKSLSKQTVATGSTGSIVGESNANGAHVDVEGGSNVIERRSRSRVRRPLKTEGETSPQPKTTKRTAPPQSEGSTTIAKRLRNKTHSGPPSTCTTTGSLQSTATRERIGNILHIAGIDRRTRAFRYAESLLCDEINKLLVQNESSFTGQPAHSKPKPAPKSDNDEDDDEDPEIVVDDDVLRPGFHDSIFYSGCGHSTRKLPHVDKEAGMSSNNSEMDDDDDDEYDETTDAGPGRRPFINPDDCPACQRRKRLAAAARKRRKSKGKRKSSKRRR